MDPSIFQMELILRLLNLINSSPTGGLITYYLSKIIEKEREREKIEKEKEDREKIEKVRGACHIKLFQAV